MEAATMSIETAAREVHAWPEGFTRVPYWAFQNEDVYRAEQKQIFQGKSWNYLCLEAEVAKPGDFRTTFIGDAPVIVTRDGDGEIYAFENRCAHRGALICLDNYGVDKKDFSCVYHAWTYDLKGNLIGVAFKDGVKGKGGMPPSFRMEDHSPRKLRIALVHGLVFGSFSEEVPPIEEYIGETIMARIERVLAGRAPVVIGRYTQVLPNNWKLYMENVKDSYHASILHLFFTTFEINRLSQTGAIIVDESGGNHVSYSQIDRAAGRDQEYANQQLRSDSQYRLADLNWTILGFEDDTPDQRLARLKQANLVGPAGYVSMEDGCVGGFVQRGIAGSPNEQAVLEMGGSVAESSESRVTEASVRGFWKAYRTHMGL